MTVTVTLPRSLFTTDEWCTWEDAVEERRKNRTTMRPLTSGEVSYDDLSDWIGSAQKEAEFCIHEDPWKFWLLTDAVVKAEELVKPKKSVKRDTNIPRQLTRQRSN